MGTILYVDDHRLNHRMIVDYMGRLGYEVVGVQTAADAIDYLKTQSVVLAIFDIGMPVMNGLELCQWVRNQPDLASLPILILSAYQGNSWYYKAEEAGADDFLTKPVNLQDLAKAVKRLTKPQQTS